MHNDNRKYKIIVQRNGQTIYETGFMTQVEIYMFSTSFVSEEALIKSFNIPGVLDNVVGLKAHIMYYKHNEEPKIDFPLFYQDDTGYTDLWDEHNTFKTLKSLSTRRSFILEYTGRYVDRPGLSKFIEAIDRTLTEDFESKPIDYFNEQVINLYNFIVETKRKNDGTYSIGNFREYMFAYQLIKKHVALVREGMKSLNPYDLLANLNLETLQEYRRESYTHKAK